MNKSTKIIIGVIIAVIVIAGIWYGVSRKPAEKEQIKIGAILPLSGDFAILGEEIRRGIEIGVDEVKDDLSLKLIYEDDQSLVPTAAVDAANKLINIDKVNIGLTMLVEESRPIAPLFNNNKTPLLVLWDSNRFIKEAGEYIFSNGFSTEKAGELMAEYAFNNLSLRRVAVISHLDPWAEIISMSFIDKFKSFGGSIIYFEKLTPDTQDYRTAIMKIKELKPDGVYFPLIPPSSIRFLIQAKEINLNTTLLTGDALISDVINEAGEAAEGIYFTNIYPIEALDTLIKKYKEMYRNDPIDPILISFGYEGVKLIKEAVKITKTKSLDLKESLIYILGPGRSADRLEKIYKVVNGKPAEVSQ